LKRFAVFLASALFLCAGTTRTWLQSDASDFEKDQLHGLSLRSDGRLSLAPKTSELFDASSAYLWALARDSKGNLYTGGGPGARLFQIAPDGSHKKLAEFDALEIHAIAIDAKDQVYAATSPDGKIYRVSADGKSDVFYDPKQKYIWGMAFGPHGDLFVATGDAGQIHRVDANGKGAVFFKTQETHARSIAVDAQGNILVGTAPGGLILRISPAGSGFVLYQMLKREITAIAAAPDGSVYAAGLAGGGAGVFPLPAPMAVALLQPGSTPAEPPAPRPLTTGGVEVYRINPSGAPEKVWTNPRDTVYAIAFDRGGHAILGAGNKGTLYRIDSNSLSTALLNVASTQITSLVTGNDGAFYASTGNVGKVFRFGPDQESSGTLESDVFDSAGFSQWGRLKAEGTGKIELFSRSGNVDRPHENWSAWAPVKERSASPPSRFLQWKAVLSAGAELDSVEAAYLPKNVAPRIEEIEITPPNYRFTPPATDAPPSAPAAAISLPALGKKTPQGTSAASLDPGIAMTYSKGWIGARWNAGDENGDALLFTVEIRGEQEKQWRPLADKIREKHYTFDSTAFPDGEYRLRLTASDAPGNVEAEALHAEANSPPFYIDNTPPEISGLSARRQGNGLQASWKVTDALNVIQRAEYSLDDGDWNLVEPTGKLSDSLSLSYELAIPNVSGGEHVLAIRATDEYGNQVVSKAVAN
jgi:sugar lactone lactonase YvrE